MDNVWAISDTQDEPNASMDRRSRFHMRVVLLILVVVITIAVIAWDMIEF